ncbi:MAG TPA: hypothetical protein VFR32_07900 [Gaiellaceae bacterium]|nr:hypothetical protein [Gaiellaceae bacterium]
MSNNKSTLRRVLEWGGIAAGAVMVAFGIAAIYMGVDGRSTVQSNLGNEFIVGTPDMTPAEIQKEIPVIVAAQKKIAAARAQAGAEPIDFTPVEAPSCTVAGDSVDTGSEARCFAEYLRIHALGSSNGLTYAQMGRFMATPDAPAIETDFNGGTSNDEYALVDEQSGQPVSNGVRNLWVTATALSSALNLAYTAEQISLFGIVVGFALLLTGIGLIILAVAVLHRAPARVGAGAKASALETNPAH